ncbi:MAG: hypothetical protein LBC72_04720, partial [Spirochaetaceae bacterium]|nr:hypothetical protein [Spirochaetaceae bacterium]
MRGCGYSRSRGHLPRAVAGLAALLLGSCLSITDGAGRLMDGSLFAEKVSATAKLAGNTQTKVARVSGKNIGQALRVSSSRLPNLYVYTTAPDAAGRVQLTAVSLFCSSYFGWNELRYAVYGSGVYTAGNDGAALRFDTPIEIIDIAGGGIRHGNTRLAGEKALEELRRRDERIDALVAWMKKPDNPFASGTAASGAAAAASGGEEAFAAYWKAALLPETFAASRRQGVYKQFVKDARAAGERAVYEFGEDVFWNAGYTAFIFPEFMRRYRDTGALLRDWQEAQKWIYIKYIWQSLPEYLVMPAAGGAGA